MNCGEDLAENWWVCGAASAAASAAPNSNVDRDLFNDLVQIVPLVHSLIDRKANRSFTRRASIIYTKTPSRGTYLKGRSIGQSIPIKKKKDNGEKEQGKNGSQNSDDEFSMFSSRDLTSKKDKEDLIILKEQVEELERKLWEKDELLNSAENSIEQMSAFNAKLDELRHRTSEKDSLLNYTQQQLTDAKIKLADKQAALEKIQWEAMTSTKKVEKLQNELDSMQTDISSFTLLLEGLTKTDTAGCTDDYDVKPYDFTHLSSIDDLDLQKMEDARKTYIAAVSLAKERRDEESIAAAASARLHLQSFVLAHTNLNL